MPSYSGLHPAAGKKTIKERVCCIGGLPALVLRSAFGETGSSRGGFLLAWCPAMEAGTAWPGHSAKWGSLSAQLDSRSPQTSCRGTCPKPPALSCPSGNDCPVAALRYFLQEVKEKKEEKWEYE